MVNPSREYICDMVSILFAQVARPDNGLVLLISGALIVLAAWSLLQSFLVHHRSKGQSGTVGLSTEKFSAAIVLGTIGWYILSRAAGLQPQGPGPQLIRDVMTRTIVLGGILLAWTVVARLFRRSAAATQDSEKMPTMEHFLESGEMILWRQHPDPRMVRGESWAAALFGALLIVPGVTAVALTTLAFLQEGPELQLVIPLFAGLVFLGNAGFLLGTPARIRRALQFAEYAITDRRLLLLHPIGRSRGGLLPSLSRHFYEYRKEQIRNRRLERRSGSRTDIVLETEQQAGRRRAYEIAVGLIGLPNWEEVEQMLEQQFPRR